MHTVQVRFHHTDLHRKSAPRALRRRRSPMHTVQVRFHPTDLHRKSAPHALRRRRSFT